MKYITIILLALSLNVTASSHVTSKEYTIVAPNYTNADLIGFVKADAAITIKNRFYDSLEELNYVYVTERGNDPKFGRVGAFTYFESFRRLGESVTVCVTNTLKPADWNDVSAMKSLGHEMLHCRGANHKYQFKSTK